MAKMNSPLHRVIDARRWDGELLLCRLFIFFHAAFVDAGFLPATAADPSASTASTLSLRYLVPLPHLLAAVAFRVCAYGRHVVFYVDTSSVSGAGGYPRRCTGSSDYLWACVDAVAAAPLLSGGLDATARALRNDPLVSALWRDLAEGLGRRVLTEICGGGALLGGTSFMSLPDNSKAEILARLGDDKDLARLSATCSDLHRLVRDRDREFWKRIKDYEAAAPRIAPEDEYRRMLRIGWSLFLSVTECLVADYPPPPPLGYEPPELFPSATEYLDGLTRAEYIQLSTRRAMAALPSSWSSSGGREKRRHHDGAINSPSARYPWKHR